MTDCVVSLPVGVWDVMSNVEVIEFVRKKIATHMKPQLVRLCSGVHMSCTLHFCHVLGSIWCICVDLFLQREELSQLGGDCTLYMYMYM